MQVDMFGSSSVADGRQSPQMGAETTALNKQKRVGSAGDKADEPVRTN